MTDGHTDTRMDNISGLGATSVINFHRGLGASFGGIRG